MNIFYELPKFISFVEQACTGIEDVGEAFLYLEEANWNLTVCILVPQRPDMKINDDEIYRC